jgi:hypothetical protein
MFYFFSVLIYRRVYQSLYIFMSSTYYFYCVCEVYISPFDNGSGISTSKFCGHPILLREEEMFHDVLVFGPYFR